MSAASDPVVVVPYTEQWPALFAEQAGALRQVLGSVALRVDHIGSTSVRGLDAKPIIDVQISVAALDPGELFRVPLERLGYVLRSDNPDRTKRYFREPPGSRRTHLHVRVAGSWAEQCALLHRDYLRVHPSEADSYARLKRDLAARFRMERREYARGKTPFIWQQLQRASDWAQMIGWLPGPPDG